MRLFIRKLNVSEYLVKLYGVERAGVLAGALEGVEDGVRVAEGLDNISFSLASEVFLDSVQDLDFHCLLI